MRLVERFLLKRFFGAKRGWGFLLVGFGNGGILGQEGGSAEG